MTEVNPSIDTSNIDAKSENSSPQQIKPNYWGLSILIAMLFVVVSIVLVFYFLKTRNADITSSQLGILPTPTIAPINTTIILPLELLSLTKSEKLYINQTYKILWKNQSLEQWGNEIIICLIGFDSSSKEIPAKKEWNEQLCTYRTGDLSGSYLIAKTKLSNGDYEWTIPSDLLARYASPPAKFKIRLLVFDTLPPEGRTEWAGNVGWDESKDYLLVGNNP